MREELDIVLEQIGVACLTVAEWGQAAAIMDGKTDDKAQYRALHAVLTARSGICGGELEALHAYFKARGLRVADLEDKPGYSNIFIGAPLE